MKHLRPIRLLLLTAVPLLGCSHGAPPPSAEVSDRKAPAERASSAPNYASVAIEGVPHVQQKPDFCGEAVTESWLRALGKDITQDQVFDLSGMDPARGMGATTRELDVALRSLGFQTGSVFTQVEADSPAAIEHQFALLHADLMRHVPSIVCTHFLEQSEERPHGDSDVEAGAGRNGSRCVPAALGELGVEATVP